MLNLTHFGLHQSGSGIPLLVQEGRVDHTLRQQFDVEVKVRKVRRTHICPHAIELDETDECPAEIANDPLAQIMMPSPKDEGAAPHFTLDTNENRALLNALMRLTAPTTFQSVQPLWLLKAQVLTEMMQITNLQPLVIYGYQPNAQIRLTKLIEASTFMPRRLIVMLPALTLATRPQSVVTNLQSADVNALPLERIGAGFLRNLMEKKLENA